MVFVTGGTGLLGARLIFDLVSAGHQVRALKRSTSDLSVVQDVFKQNGHSLGQIEWVDGDVMDYYSLLDGLQDVDDVYHCAAMVSFNPKAKDAMMKINVEGTANLVNACVEMGIRKLCYTSSVAAIGHVTNDSMITEKTDWKTSAGKSNYSISKYQSEQEVWRGIEEGLDAVIVNPSIIIGPGQWKRSSARMFLDVNRGMKYYTSGINGFVDVRDVTESMIRLMESDIVSERYIINGENLAFKEVFYGIADALKKKRPTIKVQQWMLEVLWRVDKVRTLITRGKPVISKEIAREANNISKYSNQKINEAIKLNFTPIKQSIKDTAEVFINQQLNRQ